MSRLSRALVANAELSARLSAVDVALDMEQEAYDLAHPHPRRGNPVPLLFAAVLILPFALLLGGFTGLSLVGVLLTVAFIFVCVRRAGEPA